MFRILLPSTPPAKPHKAKKKSVKGKSPVNEAGSSVYN